MHSFPHSLISLITMGDYDNKQVNECVSKCYFHSAANLIIL